MTVPALDAPSIPAPRRPEERRSVDVECLVRRTGALLAAGIPLTLLMDLCDPAGPHSRERFLDEGGDAGWLQLRRSASATGR